MTSVAGCLCQLHNESNDDLTRSIVLVLKVLDNDGMANLQNIFCFVLFWITDTEIVKNHRYMNYMGF